MGRLLAVLFLVGATPVGAATLEERLAECQEANADCKEDCTTSYGTSFKLREKLGLCLNKCSRRDRDCRGRHVELDQAGIDEDTFDLKRPADEATAPRKRAPADVPSIPRSRPEREATPARGNAEDETRSPSAEDEAPAARVQQKEERPAARTAPDRERPDRTEPAREERPAAAAASPSRATSQRAPPDNEPEDASQDGAAPPKQDDEDAARSGAKKLMEKGIEDWDPSGG